jgi:hypothetical protein
MVLLNNDFLDNILDKGLKARYSEDSGVFLTDLKNLLLAKNRLTLGKFVDGKTCVEDDEISKVNGCFSEVDFSIDKDWNKLSESRTTGRNIMDKLRLEFEENNNYTKYLDQEFENIKLSRQNEYNYGINF